MTPLQTGRRVRPKRTPRGNARHVAFALRQAISSIETLIVQARRHDALTDAQQLHRDLVAARRAAEQLADKLTIDSAVA